MENLSFEANKQVLQLIHHNQQKQSDLAQSIKKLLNSQLFKGEVVKFPISGKEVEGKIASVFCGNSPSNKENSARYNIETSSNIIEGVPSSKIKRLNTFENNKVFLSITKVATKPRGDGPWVVRDQFLSQFGIKNKLHPFFASNMNGAGQSSSAQADDSSSDDEPVVIGIRKSGVGLAPSSAGVKKAAKKSGVPRLLKSPSKKKADAKPKSPPKAGKNGTVVAKPKSQKRLSDFLTPGSDKAREGKKSLSPQLSYDEKMGNRAKSINKQVINSIVRMDMVNLNKLLDLAAANFPSKYIDKFPNEFVRYCFKKSLLKYEQKGKGTEEKARIRNEKKELQALNELLFLHRKLFAANPKFEDIWLENSSPLPSIPIIDRDPGLFFTCIRLSAFMQSYRQVLDLRNNPSLFEFMDALENGEQGFLRTTGPILTTLTDYIRKHQRTIPHFTQGYLNYKITKITWETVHLVARKILNPDYNPDDVPEDDNESAGGASRPESAMETNEDHEENGAVKQNGEKHSDNGDDEEMSGGSDDEMEIDKQTREDDELCERFCRHELHELKASDQARIFELLIERVEHSGPVRNSMRNTDGEVKTLKEKVGAKLKKMDKLNKELEEMPPLIAEEDYSSYSRATTIGIVKKNRERKGLEDQKEELEVEIVEIQKAIEEMKGCSRFRAAPIGFDRDHRRYWYFPPSPGLFIEQGAFTCQTPNEDDPLALPSKPVFRSYDLTDKQLGKHLNTLLCGGYPSETAPVKWFHINSTELLDRLYGCLNSRGVRESALREAIQKARPVLEASFRVKD